MSKFFKRIGTSKYRYQFDIYLQDAKLNIAPPSGPLSLLLKRGSKKIQTKGKLSLSGGVLSINQRMSMLATMYRDKKGKFQEKTATIQVISHVPGKSGANKLIAATKIDLSRYAIPPRVESRIRMGGELRTPRDRSSSSTCSGNIEASSQTTQTPNTSTQCVHQICLKLLKSTDPDARLSLEVRSLYMEEASTLSQISSIGSDYTSMGELSCDSDASEDRSGLRMSNVALKKKAKKLSLANQKELEIMSRECTPQVQVKRVELHKKNIRSQDITRSSTIEVNDSQDGNTPRPFKDFSNDINIHQLQAGIYKTEIKTRPKSPIPEPHASDTDQNERPQCIDFTQHPKVAEYSVGRDSSRSTHSSASCRTAQRGEEDQYKASQKGNGGNYGSVTFRGKRPNVKEPSYLNSFQLKQKREEQFKKVITKLKEKKPAFNLAKEAFLASSKKIIAAKIMPPKRFKNYSFSGSVSTHSESISASPLESRIETPSDMVKGAVCITENTQVESSSVQNEKGVIMEKLEQTERENDNLRIKLSKIQKENSKLKLERERQDDELKKREEENQEGRILVDEMQKEAKDQNIQIKKLKEKLQIQNNVVRDLREKLEVMIQRATSHEEQNERFSRQGIIKEMEALKKEMRQRVEEKKKETETNKLLHIKLEESETKCLLLEKENREYRENLDQLLFNYQTLEEELAEERAQHRETKMMKEQRNTKRLKFLEMQVRSKLYEIQNLKIVISEDMQLMGGEQHEYQKEIQKQLTQIRIEHQLQKEKQKEIQRYSKNIEGDLMEAKIALGRYKDDNSRFQKHIEKITGELEASKKYGLSLEIDVFRSRQELAESVNVIGEYEKENIELQNRLNSCYEKLGVS